MADISKDELRKEITAILQDADLTTMSAKRVRTLLEEQLETDLTDRKKEVDDLVMKCLQEKQKSKAGNGAKKGDDDDEEEEEEDEEEEEEEEKPKAKRGAKKPPVSNKRAKKASSDSEDGSVDEDASDDDYSPAKKSKGSPKKGKAGKKKAKGSDDDDDEDWNKSKKKSGGGAKKAAGGGGPKKGSGYTKALPLTPELAAVVGQDTMPRHEVVKKVWAIIKEKNLYDPKNKQFAICDDQLFKVFGVKRFRTFGMMKYLKNHFIQD